MRADIHPWLESYPEAVDWDGVLPSEPLHMILDQAVTWYGDKPCLDFLGRTYTYREVGEMVDHAARGFQLLGVGKGTRVGLCLPNSPCHVVCYYAVLKAGGTVVNFSPLAVERELADQVADSGTSIMVTMDLKQLYPKVSALIDENGLERVVVCRMRDILPPVKGVLFSVLKRSELADFPEDLQHVPFEFLVGNDGKPRPVEIDPETDVAVLQYTGGTTGVPKGAMLTHANLSANLSQIHAWFPGLEPGAERIVAVLPFFHAFAMTAVMNFGLSIGAELVLLPRFELKQVLQTMDSRKPTLFAGVPTIFTAINEAPDIESFDLRSLKFCISGGAPLPIEVKRCFEGLSGCKLVEGYGLSEASPVVTCNVPGGEERDGTIGLPLPRTVIDIRDLENPKKSVPQGERGEVCVKGPQVMAGYWERPDETERTIRDGWLHTGDVGFIDESGFVHLVDRIKDLILCSGFNVYPRHIEEALYEHPAVAEAVVVGISDSYRGQAPKAFVALKDGEAANADDLKAFLRERLSPIERPREIEFRDELPKTLIGKLSKKELQDEENARAGTGQAA